MRYLWQVRWSNPHKPLPAGMAEVIFEFETIGSSAGACPAEVNGVLRAVLPEWIAASEAVLRGS